MGFDLFQRYAGPGITVSRIRNAVVCRGGDAAETEVFQVLNLLLRGLL